MKIKNLGYCGVDCNECQVLIATETNSIDLKKSYAEALNSKYGLSLKPQDICCYGCVKGTLDGSTLMGHCRDCDVRKCAGDKEVNNCSMCMDYVCSKLSDKWNSFPAEIKAKENFDNK